MKMVYASRVGYFMSLLICLAVPLEAKKLTVPQINLLNLALGALPQVTARLKLSQKHAQEMCDVLEKMRQESNVHAPAGAGKPENNTSMQQLSKQTIDAQIKKILEPIREFFSQIIEHKDMVVPLVAQSLGAYSSNQPGKTIADVSHLLAFFNENTRDIVSYFQKRITSQQDFDQAVHELKYFLDDLFDSFSQHVLQTYEKMISEIQTKKVAQKQLVRPVSSEEQLKHMEDLQEVSPAA